MRHGESVDDLTNQYGGWADFPLTPKGYNQISEVSKKIENLDLEVERIFSSPLLRAQESARIVANSLSIPVEIFPYVKEKNGYGLLSGMNKEFAIEKFPELVSMLDSGYVYGAEPADQFTSRVKDALRILLRQKYEVIMVVTHGGFLSEMFKTILNLELIKKDDGGFVLLEGDDLENLKIVSADGIEYK